MNTYRVIDNYNNYKITAEGIVARVSNDAILPTVVNLNTIAVNLVDNNGKKVRIKLQRLIDTTYPDNLPGIAISGFSSYRVTEDIKVYSVVHSKYSNPTLAKNGYLVFNLKSDEGKPTSVYLHRLIATAFVTGWFDGAHINHKDGDKKNNTISNLEWCTNQENRDHAWATGLMSSKLRRCKVSLNNKDWTTFSSLKDAKAYIEEATGCPVMTNVSKLSRCAKWNEEKDAHDTPSRVRGFIVRYTN